MPPPNPVVYRWLDEEFVFQALAKAVAAAFSGEQYMTAGFELPQQSSAREARTDPPARAPPLLTSPPPIAPPSPSMQKPGEPPGGFAAAAIVRERDRETGTARIGYPASQR